MLGFLAVIAVNTSPNDARVCMRKTAARGSWARGATPAQDHLACIAPLHRCVAAGSSEPNPLDMARMGELLGAGNASRCPAITPFFTTSAPTYDHGFGFASASVDGFVANGSEVVLSAHPRSLAAAAHGLGNVATPSEAECVASSANELKVPICKRGKSEARLSVHSSALLAQQ